jgi:hypothetical protein
MGNLSVLIVCPAFDRKLFTDTAMSLMETVNVLRDMKADVGCLFLTGDGIINRVRNGAVAEFLARPERSHLLFVDSDMQFSAKTIIRMLKFGEPFTAAPYAKKVYHNVPTRQIAPRDLDGFHEAVLDWNVTFENPAILTKGTRPDVRSGFTRVNRVGAGLILLRRDMIERMIARYPELKYRTSNPGYMKPELIGKFFGFFDPYLDSENTFVGEDYAFCDRWRNGCGGEIWCDTEARITHWGLHGYAGTLADSLNLKRNAASRTEAL